MKTQYDPEADALFVRFLDTTSEESDQIAPGIILDYDKEGRIVAVEILNASTTLAKGIDLNGIVAA